MTQTICAGTLPDLIYVDYEHNRCANLAQLTEYLTIVPFPTLCALSLLLLDMVLYCSCTF